MKRLLNFRQGKGVMAATYLEQFHNLIEGATHMGASAGLHAGLVVEVADEMQIDIIQASHAEMMAAQAAVKDRFLATSFLLKLRQIKERTSDRGY
jgi:hypothetical protein